VQQLDFSVLRDEETRVCLLVRFARRHDVSLGIVLTEYPVGRFDPNVDVLEPEVRHFCQKAGQEALNRHRPLGAGIDGGQLDDAVVGKRAAAASVFWIDERYV
jgi:hypothetical protein